jgi:hypothetical protein
MPSGIHACAAARVSTSPKTSMAITSNPEARAASASNLADVAAMASAGRPGAPRVMRAGDSTFEGACRGAGIVTPVSKRST